jgi:ligand-binding SRPBCC domain-containing protein
MKFRRTFCVRAPRDAVVDFYTRATSLGAITLPLVPMRLHRAPERMAEGDEMDFTMWLGPVPVRWVARVRDVSDGGFVDYQVRGPFASWSHYHRFVAVDEATTQVVDEIEARLRRHPLWTLIGLGMWLGLPLLFAYRGWKTRRLLEASG